MGRKTTSTEYIQPIDTIGNGVPAAPGADANLAGRGVYTLASGNTYYFMLGTQDARVAHAHLQHDNAIVITSAQIETCSMAESEVNNYDANTAGAWIPETPSTAYVGTRGAATTAANGIVAVAGGTSGGAGWHVVDTGARRMRVAVVVGATGGEVRLGVWGKE